MRILKVISLLIVVSALFGGCSSQQYPHFNSENEVYSLIDKAAKESITSADFEHCVSLPVEARYYDDRYDTDNIFVDPRAGCLWKYLQSKPDIRVCNLLEGVGMGPRSGTDCFNYVSEKVPLSLQEQCQKISDSADENVCLALVNKDIQYCQNLVSNVSKGWCIHDVVFRTRDVKPCLQIDGPEYGENWKKIRNECVIVGALITEPGQDNSSLCNSLVEDTSDKSVRERCLVGAYHNIELAPLRE